MNPVLPLAVATLMASTPDAEVLIFGGGWGPEGNQASIEAHVAAVAAALAGYEPVVLFASGSTEQRTVQAQAALDPDDVLLALVFDRLDHLEVAYRPTKLRAVRNDRSHLLAALRSVAGQTRGRRPVVVFGVGHGAPARDGQPVSVELWGEDQRVVPEDLLQALEPATGPAAAVLGQCHSGGFVDATVPESLDVPSPPRCVFAAVPADREAAGCTPDLEASDARGYVGWMAAAWSTAEADLDRDGSISLAEAHAHAVIHDPTVDLPVRTSDRWLDEATQGLELSSRTTLDSLRRLARPDEAAILEGVLTPAPDSIGEAQRQLERLMARDRELLEGIDAVWEQREELRGRVLDRLLLRAPELINPYHPASRRWLATDQVERWLTDDPESEALLAKERRWASLGQRHLAIRRKGARLERWLMTAHRVGRRAAIAKQPVVRREALRRLDSCEAIALAPGGRRRR